MAWDYVNCVVEEGIAVVTINHPPVNALDQKTVAELGQVIDELEKKPEARKMAKKILTKGPVAIAMAKRAIHEGLEMTLKEGLKLEAKLFGELFETSDMREGVKAFLEKRTPHFEGR